jgi:16S rRNA U516 pseudouridylate synthase RsuA-like enzyme
VERLLANLGYAKRQECATLVKRGRVTLAASGKALRVGRPSGGVGTGVCMQQKHGA